MTNSEETDPDVKGPTDSEIDQLPTHDTEPTQPVHIGPENTDLIYHADRIKVRSRSDFYHSADHG